MRKRTATCVGATVTGTLLLSGMPTIVSGVTTSPIEVPTDADLVINASGMVPQGQQKAVANAGDVNGDGVDDLIVGVPYDPLVGVERGAAYVIYGKDGGPTTPISAPADLVPGVTGFTITGSANGDKAGFAVSGAGDVNGDGRDDLIVGAPGADPDVINAGATYVVYGQPNDSAANINLGLTPLDPPTTGFAIDGVVSGDGIGHSVSNAGDVNNDTYDDVIVSSPFAAPNGDESGVSYVVYGKPNGSAANVDVDDLTPALPAPTGFSIEGGAVGDKSGSSVSGGMDVNGDGRDDVIIGAPLADYDGNHGGTAYVVYGQLNGDASDIDLSTDTLDPGSTGYLVSGAATYDYNGYSVSGVDDVNGDGRDDVVIGAIYADPNGNASGTSYIVYGKTNAAASNILLSTTPLIPKTTGFQVDGAAAYNASGASVAGAGDVNGDGRADVAIGAPGAAPNGDGSGSVYVIYGQQNGSASNIDLATVALNPGSSGFETNGATTEDFNGAAVTGGGDLNGDGLADVAAAASGGDFVSAVFGTRIAPVVKKNQSQYPVNLRLPRRGARVANTVNATTRQGLPLTARIVSQAARGDVRCARIIKGPKRRLVIRTTGQCRFVRVTVRYTAPGNATYKPYAKILRFRTR